MPKKTVYTKITPLPSNIPRQLAIDMLHSHEEVIKLNPLVTGVAAIDAPREAASDEFFSSWYEITEIITWGPAFKKKISFKGVFHNQPWGLQSHVYAPMGVDMRNKYRIGGNQPGEPREARELGLDIPQDGLYLREDVEIICAVPLTTNFVKKEAKAATGIMVQRLTRKAELLDEGKLHAMFENGTLKTAKPNTQPTLVDRPSPHSNYSSPDLRSHGSSSPTFTHAGTLAPPIEEGGYGRYHDVAARNAAQRDNPLLSPQQAYGFPHGAPQPHYAHPAQHYQQQQKYNLPSSPSMPVVYEMGGNHYYPQQVQSGGMYPAPLMPPGVQQFRAELPGDDSLMPPTTPRSDVTSNPTQQRLPTQPNPYPSPQSSSGPSQGPYPEKPDPSSLPPHPAYVQRARMAHDGNGNDDSVAEWQRGLHNASNQDPNLIRLSRAGSEKLDPNGQLRHPPSAGGHYEAYQPDPQRFSQMSLGARSTSHPPAPPR